MIELRVLSPDDWPLWRDLRLAALAEAPQAFGSTLADWQHAAEERWRERLGIAGSCNLVAVLDGRAAGMVSGVPGEAAGSAELISMWVSPHARGQGVGDRLVQAVEAWARQAGARVLRLAVTPGNGSARALYLRQGFADTGKPGDLMADGESREIVMAKPVGPA